MRSCTVIEGEKIECVSSEHVYFLSLYLAYMQCPGRLIIYW